MRWDYLLIEVYCFDDECRRSYSDHLEDRQGSWCEGHLGGFLYGVLGMRTILKHYLRELWEDIYSTLRWHLWGRWTFDDEAFLAWVRERTVEESEEEIEKYRCKFPDDEA